MAHSPCWEVFATVSVFPGIKPQNSPNGIKTDNIKNSSLMKGFRCTNMALNMHDKGFLQFLSG